MTDELTPETIFVKTADNFIKRLEPKLNGVDGFLKKVISNAISYRLSEEWCQLSSEESEKSCAEWEERLLESVQKLRDMPPSDTSPPAEKALLQESPPSQEDVKGLDYFLQLAAECQFDKFAMKEVLKRFRKQFDANQNDEDAELIVFMDSLICSLEQFKVVQKTMTKLSNSNGPKSSVPKKIDIPFGTRT